LSTFHWIKQLPEQPLSPQAPDVIILATATCHGLTLATRNSRDFTLSLGCVVHPYKL